VPRLQNADILLKEIIGLLWISLPPYFLFWLDFIQWLKHGF
jgi:hypothetical protein